MLYSLVLTKRSMIYTLVNKRLYNKIHTIICLYKIVIHIKISRKIFASMLLVIFSSDVILDDLAIFLLFFWLCDSFLFLLFSFFLSFFFCNEHI